MLTSSLSEKGEVKVHAPNQSDLYSKTAGDVEVFYGGRLASASECKHRPLTADDVQHGIGKAHAHRCPEYLFVCAAGVARGQEDEVAAVVEAAGDNLDVALVHVHKALPALAIMLNPTRRASYGVEVAARLRKMRKFESANQAAELWNGLSKGERGNASTGAL